MGDLLLLDFKLWLGNYRIQRHEHIRAGIALGEIQVFESVSDCSMDNYFLYEKNIPYLLQNVPTLYLLFFWRQFGPGMRQPHASYTGP